MFTTYQVLFTHTQDLSCLHSFEIQADSKDAAYENALQQLAMSNEILGCEAWELTQLQRKPQKQGGARVGAGRPTKHGEPTKTMRVPQSLSKDIDWLTTALPELRQLLADLEADCKNQPSPRRHFLKQALEEIRSIGF